MNPISGSRPAHAPTDPSPAAPAHGATTAPVGGAAHPDLAGRAREGAQETASQRPRLALPSMPGEAVPAAAYRLARHVDRRPVDREGVERLALADQALAQARHSLPEGRGNVDPDRATAELPAAAAQMLHRELVEMGFQRGPDPAVSVFATAAMTGKVFGAGVCDNYAGLAALSYGVKAQEAGRPPQEQVRILSHEENEHTWAEVHAPEEDAPAIVMDGWRDGPAVFAEDAGMVRDAGQVQVNASMDLAAAAEAHEWVDEFARGFMGQRFMRLDQAEDELAEMEPRAARVPPPLLDEAFAGRVQERLQAAEPRELLQAELQAMSLAASYGSQGVANLASDASRILQEAWHLTARPEGGG
jgi:hypothetical protein